MSDKVQIARTSRRYNTYSKIAGLLLLAGGIQFMLDVVIGESQYPGYSTSKNTLSDMSGSCPSIDPGDPLRCVDSVVIQPSATIFSTIVFVVGVTAAASAYFIHKTLGGRIAPALLAATGIGAIGVAVFPGNAGIAHVIFATATFYAGGLAAIASYRILRESRPMQYLSIALGAIAVAVLASVLLPDGGPFVSAFGVGGAERLVAYPIVLWLVALGGYLLAVSSLARTKEAIER